MFVIRLELAQLPAHNSLAAIKISVPNNMAKP
jgi:hypothetical protein